MCTNMKLRVFIYCCVLMSTLFVVEAGFRSALTDNLQSQDHNYTPPSKPCDVCPRRSKCVAKVQCPAHVRPRSNNPLCHIGGHENLVGVCCFTGSRHAAETDMKPRSAASVPPNEIKKIHKISMERLEKFMKSDQELSAKPNTILNNTSPSFGHHLSMVTNDPIANELSKGALMNLFAVQELRSRDAISDEEILLGFTRHTDGPFCPPTPSCPDPPNRYKSISGECNNPIELSWGAVRTGYQRLLPANYGDGLWSFRSSVSGLPLPPARSVSANLLLPTSRTSDSHNLMFMQFGQFIVHDVSAAAVFTLGNGSAISCCVGDGQDFLPGDSTHWACAPILVPLGDHFYDTFKQRCHNFVRAQLAPASDCSVGYASQMNGVSHIIDLSHIYGSSEEKVSLLRSSEGLLKTMNDFGRDLPPLTDRQECMSSKSGAACFESGDNHGNQVISLTILHTIWTREHNRIAKALNRLNVDWNEDRVFFETRRILQAMFQHIIYNEWLPMLLAPHHLEAFGLTPSPGYSDDFDPHINPAIAAEFSAAAMRFGHSVVDGKLWVPDVSSNTLYESISLPEVMFQPTRLRLRPFLDRLITGMTMQPMQNVDPFVSESLTRYLFHGGNPFGLDLASINIQRGRDFGLRSYNDYRTLVGLEPIRDFGHFTPNAANRLSSVYSLPDDIDLWVGGLLEEPTEGSVLGETFANIIAEQFSRSKKGDRYFYDHGPQVNPGAFTPSQLVEIKKVTLSRVICNNRDGIELQSMPPNAFLRSDLPGNTPVPCDSPIIPSMDLTRFKEL